MGSVIIPRRLGSIWKASVNTCKQRQHMPAPYHQRNKYQGSQVASTTNRSEYIAEQTQCQRDKGPQSYGMGTRGHKVICYYVLNNDRVFE